MPDSNRTQVCRQNGLTLIEVMLALLLFSVGILAVASMQITSMNSHRLARVSSWDTFAVSSQLELLAAMPSTHAWLSVPEDDSRILRPNHAFIPLHHGSTGMEWEIDATLSLRNAKRIAVSLHRPQQPGGRRYLTFEVIRAGSYETGRLIRQKFVDGS